MTVRITPVYVILLQYFVQSFVNFNFDTMTEPSSINIMLPVKFSVQYLGTHPTKGLQGIKYTRTPVEFLVTEAKNMKSNEILPQVKLEVTEDNISYTNNVTKKNTAETVTFKADTISYCVQDIKYSRVVSMIVVGEDSNTKSTLFNCFSFLCESTSQARKVTSAISESLKRCGEKMKGIKKKVVVDLRTSEELSTAEGEEEIEI